MNGGVKFIGDFDGDIVSFAIHGDAKVFDHRFCGEGWLADFMGHEMFHAAFQRPDIEFRRGGGDLLNGDHTMRAKDDGDGGGDGSDDFGGRGFDGGWRMADGGLFC